MHVRRQLGAVEVQDLETLPLPGLVPVDVDGGSDARRRRRLRVVHDADAAGDALETVHHEDGIEQLDDAVAQLVEALTAHVQLHVRNAPLAVPVHQLRDLGVGQHLTLVRRRVDRSQAVGIDDPPPDELAILFIQGGVRDDYLLRRHGYCSFVRWVSTPCRR